jgi:hypothetical protein
VGRPKINDGLTATQRYAQKHPERRLASYRKWRENNRSTINTKRRAYYAKNTDKAYFGWTRKQYGVDREQYEEMMQTQNAKCAICGVDFSTLSRRPAIDHNHATGEVRALLCNPCNARVGFVETEATYRVAVLSYLEQHNKEG